MPRKAIKACQGKGQGALVLREWPRHSKALSPWESSCAVPFPPQDSVVVHVNLSHLSHNAADIAGRCPHQNSCDFLVPGLSYVSEGKGFIVFVLIHINSCIFSRHVITSTKWSTSNGDSESQWKETCFEDMGSGWFCRVTLDKLLHLSEAQFRYLQAVTNSAFWYDCKHSMYVKSFLATLAFKVSTRKWQKALLTFSWPKQVRWLHLTPRTSGPSIYLGRGQKYLVNTLVVILSPTFL